MVTAQHTTPILKASKADLQLTCLVASGDRDAARRLILLLLERVQRTCDYLVKGDESADLAQMALMEIVRSAGQFRGESSVAYWADRITVRTAAKEFEKRDRRKRIFERFFVPSKPTEDTERQASLGQLRVRLLHHLWGLPKEQRMVVVLHYLHEYEVPEIADLIGEKINTVRSRLSRGLARLRKRILADQGLSPWVGKGRR